jgi:membrane protein YdbS with pleckstrin-like domain
MRDVYMVELGEDFKPALQYRPYLAIYTIIVIAIIWVFCAGWVFLIDGTDGIPAYASAVAVAILIAIVVFILFWTVLYYKSVVYHLNTTEMTWKRGVWFRKTGIVPYNRITNVDIVQGPVMRLFGISNLKIQTAGYSGSNSSSEISIEGIVEPEPLRTLIMDFVRGATPSPAATGGAVEKVPQNADLAALIREVAAIRKLLEEKS